MNAFIPHKVKAAYEQCIEQLQFDEPTFEDYNAERDGAMLQRHVYSLVESEDCWTVFETRIYNDEYIGQVKATSPRYYISIDESFDAEIEEVL
jgi:hypothetical protein